MFVYVSAMHACVRTCMRAFMCVCVNSLPPKFLIPSVAMSDAGIYTCSDGQNMSPPSDFVFCSKFNLTASIFPFPPLPHPYYFSSHTYTYIQHTAIPVLRRAAGSSNTSVGDELTVECEFGGIPRPTVEWRKDGAVLVGSPGNLEIISPSDNPDISRVVVSSATSADTGLYTCTGTNTAGSVSGMISVNVVIIECEYMTTAYVWGFR